ncbi:MAG: HAD family phosphatase [Ferruginibacter sp.]
MQKILKNDLINTVLQLLYSFNAKAVIFDLDGTLIDNNSFHLISWKKYLEKIGIDLGEEEYRRNINGRTNKDAIEYIYKRKMSDDEAMVFALEKEAVYRQTYLPHIKPVAGLIDFLKVLHQLNIPMAIATSGIQVNIDFMFEHIPIRQYFTVVVNSAHISKGKPDPEIYIKTADLLHVHPANCLVFEDAAVGIISAKKAGMKVIALTTTQLKEELAEADMIVDDYICLNHDLFD